MKKNRNICKILRPLFFAVLAAAVLCSLALAGSRSAGTSTAQFLKLGAGARAAGMAGAFAGMADDSTAIYWNPAGLLRLKDKSLSVMHAAWFEGISYDWLSYAMPLSDIETFGIAYQYMSYGSITKMDNTGLAGDSINPSDNALSLTYARDMKFAGLGINFKNIASTIENTASAVCVDIGLLRVFMDNRLYTGLVVQNIGSSMQFINEADPLPMNVKLGAAYTLRPNCKVDLDINVPVDEDINLCLGGEYWLNETMALRAGYKTVQDLDALSSLSLGLGINISRNVIFDFAWNSYGDLGTTQRYSLNVYFGQAAKQEKKAPAPKPAKAKKEKIKELLPAVPVKQKPVNNKSIITGKITDLENKSLGNALVKLIKNGKELLLLNASTGGTYRIVGVPPGEYVIGLWKAGYVGVRKTVVLENIGKTVDVSAALEKE